MSGASVRSTAHRYGLGQMALGRHMKLHAKRDLAKATESRNGKAGNNLLDELVHLRDEVLAILRKAKRSKSLSDALEAINTACRIAELKGRATGEIASGGSVTVINQLGVRIDQAKQAVESVSDAQSLMPRAVVERAAQVIRMWNASADESEQVEVIAPRARTRSEAQVIE
jgi:hypothetical protein